MEEEHKTTIRYCDDIKGFLLVCEKCNQCLFLGDGKAMPKDCSGDEYEGNNYSGRIWKKQH